MDQALTFYIAASGKDIPRVRALADKLKARGMKWYSDWDWTEHYGEDESLEKVILDLAGAMRCDHFIFIDSDVPSVGANREWGARWGTGRHIWSIQGNHMFDLSTLVTDCEDEEDFLEKLI